MLPHHAPAPQPTGRCPPVRIGVGIDTSRYGHYAAFLRDDLQPAADELPFAESAAGYAQLRQRLEQHRPAPRPRPLRRPPRRRRPVRRQPAALPAPPRRPRRRPAVAGRSPSPSPAAIRNATRTTAPPSSAAKKSDPVEARAAARFALSRTAHAAPRRCRPNCAPSARSPADSRPSSANAPASSTSSTTCSP